MKLYIIKERNGTKGIIEFYPSQKTSSSTFNIDLDQKIDNEETKYFYSFFLPSHKCTGSKAII